MTDYEEVDRIWEQTYLGDDGSLLYVEDTLDEGQAELDDSYLERYEVKRRRYFSPHPETLHGDIESLEEAKQLLDAELE